jgi:hypothetical protein
MKTFSVIFLLVHLVSAEPATTEQEWAVLGRPLTISCQSGSDDCLLLSPAKETFVRDRFYEAPFRPKRFGQV